MEILDVPDGDARNVTFARVNFRYPCEGSEVSRYNSRMEILDVPDGTDRNITFARVNLLPEM
jgi:hypothetical protein